MKQQYLYSVALVLAVILSGCASPKYNYIPVFEEISEPPIGEVVTAYVGDAMVRQGTFSWQDALKIKKETKVGLLMGYTFVPGYYVKKGEDQKAEYYLPSGGPNSGRVLLRGIPDPFKIIKRDKKSGKICGVTVFNAQVCTDNTDYVLEKIPVANADSFQQTLIYSGKVGNKINIGYREFSNDHARPAFNNDVEYDLEESTTIGYKGCRIEIIEATNELIKYRVIRNFNTEKY